MYAIISSHSIATIAASYRTIAVIVAFAAIIYIYIQTTDSSYITPANILYDDNVLIL